MKLEGLVGLSDALNYLFQVCVLSVHDGVATVTPVISMRQFTQVYKHADC